MYLSEWHPISCQSCQSHHRTSIKVSTKPASPFPRRPPHFLPQALSRLHTRLVNSFVALNAIGTRPTNWLLHPLQWRGQWRPSRGVSRWPNAILTIYFLPLTGLRVFSIVLVHGLGGHPKDTWSTTAAKGKEKIGFFSRARSRGSDTGSVDGDGGIMFWPSDLLPQTIKNARIMTYGYDSDPLVVWNAVNRTNIFHHAKDLLIALTAQRRDNVCTSVTSA